MPTRFTACSGRMRLSRLVALAVFVLAALVPVLFGAAPPQPLPTQRVDLKVLVVAGGPTSTASAWQAALQREGVPFTALTAGSINDGVLADYGANRAKFQAVIVTTGVPLPTAAADALAKFEATFGIRQISDIGDEFNLGFHGVSGYRVGSCPSQFDALCNQTGKTASLTALGQQMFPYLKAGAPIQIEGPGTFGFEATFGASVRPLLVTAAGGVFMGIYTDPTDSREELVMTVSSNQFQLHNQLLRHGMLNWVTRGVYLGTQRNYFTMQIDDVFLPDAKWDPIANSTPGDASQPNCGILNLPPCPEVRMSPADVRDAINWQNANGIKFDLTYNGEGVGNARAASPTNTDPLSDDPVNGLLANKGQFRWINHTFAHEQLDSASLPLVTNEINNNITFANSNGIAINPQEVVTGEHSGLGTYQGVLSGGQPLNPNVVTAFNNLVIRWAGDDNSAKPAQRGIGNALTVPRYPSNVYYNVATRADQLDEYNWIYRSPTNPPSPEPNTGGCTAIPGVTTCRTSAAQWLVDDPSGEQSYVNSEVGIIFRHLMGNDPRPHYAHQSNLILDANGLGILYKRPGVAGEPGVLDALLARYNSYFNVSLAQPTMSESGQLLHWQAAWSGHVAANRVSGYLLDGKVHVVATQAADVPLTGVNVGDLYGGQRSGWTTVGAGDTVFTPVDPANTVPPSVAGTPAPNNTLKAVAGVWTGTPPITTAYQWQRCSAAGCVNIAGVNDADYKAGTIDRGYGIRVVQMAGNLVSSVSQAPSATVLVPGPTPPPGLPPTAPAPGNVPPALTVLRLTDVTVTPRRFKAQRIVRTRAASGVVRKRVVGGTLIRWRLNAVAKVTITVQRKKGKKWVTVGAIQRDAKAGISRFRFSGRVRNNRLIKPGSYRFAIRASRSDLRLKTPVKAVRFTFLKG